MELSLSKSGPQGSYYYSTNDLVYGPFTIPYLLPKISASTMVNNGDGWKKAREYPELNFKSEERNYKIPFYIISTLSAALLIFILYTFSQNQPNVQEPKTPKVGQTGNTDTVSEPPKKPPVVKKPVVHVSPVGPKKPPVVKTKFQEYGELKSREEKINKIGQLLSGGVALKVDDKPIVKETFYLMLDAIESGYKIETCNLISTYIRALKKNDIPVDETYRDKLKKTCLLGN